MIDPSGIDLIMASLLGGLAAGTGAVASRAVVDAYGDVRDAVVERLRKSRHGHVELPCPDSSPDELRALRQELTDEGVDHDQEVARLVRVLRHELNEVHGASSRYGVHITNSKGIAVGDHSTVHVDSWPGDRTDRRRTPAATPPDLASE